MKKVQYTDVLFAVKEYRDAARQISQRDKRIVADVLFDILLPEFQQGDTEEWQG